MLDTLDPLFLGMVLDFLSKQPEDLSNGAAVACRRLNVFWRKAQRKEFISLISRGRFYLRHHVELARSHDEILYDAIAIYMDPEQCVGEETTEEELCLPAESYSDSSPKEEPQPVQGNPAQGQPAQGQPAQPCGCGRRNCWMNYARSSPPSIQLEGTVWDL